MGVGDIRERFQSNRNMFDLNYFYGGKRDRGSVVPEDDYHSTVHIRTRMRGGIKSLSQVPNNFIVPVEALQFPEGLDVILPYIRTSPGYRLFETSPLIRMKDLQHQVFVLHVSLKNLASEMNQITNINALQERILALLDVVKSVPIQKVEAAPAVINESKSLF
jgi:hypothetical protein